LIDTCHGCVQRRGEVAVGVLGEFPASARRAWGGADGGGGGDRRRRRVAVQLHLQHYDGHEWQYDFEEGRFMGLPRDLEARLMKDTQFLRDLERGLKYLGEDR
jgi:hypothetical protein